MPRTTLIGHGAPRRRTLAIAAAAALAGGMLAAPNVANAATGHTANAHAQVIGSAAQGGAVIVWLRDQHSNLSLTHQGAARTAAAHTDQKPIVSSIQASGGTDVIQLVSLNAVAAHVSSAEVRTLSAMPAVLKILPDTTVTVGDHETRGPQTRSKVISGATQARARSQAVKPNATNTCGSQATPLIEPEALMSINAPAMTDAGLSTEPGHGVIVANDGISTPPDLDLVGNPNFVRPAADGGGSVVVDATPGDTTDSTDGEYYGDASSIDAQGTQEYQYSAELPYSGLDPSCWFILEGDAPGASLVDTENIDTPESGAGNPAVLSESQIISGIDAAVIKEHADVINESYGYNLVPGSYAAHYAANDAAVASGVTVVVSSGDSGPQGTVSSPASDPMVIAAGATNTLRESAMNYGFADWVNNDITPLSSGGTTPNNKLVDLVAPGYGGEAACNPDGSDCPTNTQTEAFGGTSESSPLIAGAAADVIQAYRDSHNGASPSPALVKQLLTSTSTDVASPADQQGAGLLNITAAVQAAQQQPNTTLASATAPTLISSPTQLDLTGAGGSTSFQSVNLYNSNNASTTVTGTYRELGPQQPIGSVVTENVSAPDPSLPVPNDGADAAQPISFDVPAGLDRLTAQMIWPDPTNSTILNFILTDPEGRLRDFSYDYGTAGPVGGIGSVPDIQSVQVANPEAGPWTVQIKWGNGRAHLQEPPNVPGSYTGTVSFQATGQNFITSPASGVVTIGAHRSATIPLSVAMPTSPGDHPESVQFAASDGAATSLPIARRTLIPTTGGEFDTTITNTVGRGSGQISSYDVNVPSGQPDLGITVTTPDIQLDDPMTLFLVNPSGLSVASHSVTSGNPPRTRLVNGVPLTVQTVNGTPMATATYSVANPAAGTWEIDVELNLTTSGQEFTQTVVGDLLSQAPVITSPADGSNATSQTPTISGTGTGGRTITVVDGSGNVVCTALVASDGTWSCTATTQSPGPVTLHATQADQTGDASLASNSVTMTIPSPTSVVLTLDPQAPAKGQDVNLTATTTSVPDGTLVTFYDGTSVLGTGTVTGGTASLDVPSGFGTGDHQLTAAVAATTTTTASVSPIVDVMIGKSTATVVLTLTTPTTPYGQHPTGTLDVSGATGGTATVTVGGVKVSVPIDGTGSGSFTLSNTLSVGNHTVSAVYNGSGSVARSGPVKTTLSVVPAITATSLALSTSTITHGTTESVTVTVSRDPSPFWPTGKVTVFVTSGGKTVSKSATLSTSEQGVVTLTIKAPAHAGTADVYATYGGSTKYVGSTSAHQPLTVT